MGARAVVIAHRGASGYLPEHTLEAKALAHAMGADYIEQDVVSTRDGQLVVLHDIFLDDVTNVAEVFPGRSRDDGLHYVVDFDLVEIRRLRVVERRRRGTQEPLFPERFRATQLPFRVSTLREELELIRELNRTTGREAGVYAEVKEPAWHLRHGIDVSQKLLQTLVDFGYDDSDSLAFVQCFDARELLRMHTQLRTRLRLVQLLPAVGVSPAPVETALAAIAEYACAVGLPYEQLVAGESATVPNAPLLDAIRAAGLAVHAYTFQRDRLPPWADSLDRLLRLYVGELGIDGVFCDHPDIAVRAVNALSGRAFSTDGQAPETGLE